MTVSHSLAEIQDRIAAVKASLPATVRLIGVTKTKPSSYVRAAYAAGLRDFGESRIQEAIAKQEDLKDLEGITWHLIGHLQTNKARKALNHFDWIHSLDSLKLAYRLNDLAAELPQKPICCLQVKMVSDPAKYGFQQAELWEALPVLNQLQHLNIVGLMTIPPLGISLADSEQIFQQAHGLQQRINRQSLERLQLTELSMGMSGDYPAALNAGTTLIRLGTTLFGDRIG